MAEDTSFWHGRKVLVTGCTGFLGGAVARELFARGAEVVGLVNERPATDILGTRQGGRVHLVRGRTDNVFRLHSAMAVHEVSVVFHLAAREPLSEDVGTQALLQAVKLYSRRVPVVTARPISELASAAGEPRDERLSAVRFGEVFGPGDRKLSRVVPATAIAVLTGEATPTPPESPPRDFVFVGDAARACLRAAEAPPGEYPFRSGWVRTDRQMATAMRDVFAGRPIDASGPAPSANPFGWQPQQTPEDSLRETLAWYRDFLRAGCSVPVRAAA